MDLLRKILFPFAAIYGLITWLRNYFYDKGIFKSTAFGVPVIAVGNLSVGGTGKSPQIEYLIRLLSPRYKVATLSRGYKRKSKGFMLAGQEATAEILGDEPFQFHSKFPHVAVAVDADRTNGIKQLLSLAKPDVVLLDDAFQHRRVKAGFYILLTAYGDLYVDDFLLPAGNLRESWRGAKRANVIVVTKCPIDLPARQQNAIRARMRLKPHQELYFSFIDYDDKVYSQDASETVAEIRENKKVLIAGIAKPKPFFDHLGGGSDIVLEFPDHHRFSENEIAQIKAEAAGKPVITTEKDYVRLKGRLDPGRLFYLPIRSAFLADADNFDKTILDHVGKST